MTKQKKTKTKKQGEKNYAHTTANNPMKNVDFEVRRDTLHTTSHNQSDLNVNANSME